MSETKIILDYHDSLLYEADVKLLEPSKWLNDKIIAFIFEYFEHDKYKHVFTSNSVACITPSIVQLIKLTKDLNEAISCFMDPLRLDEKKIILIPINDNSNASSGGSHWSLLIIDRETKTAYHLDSALGSSNRKVSQAFFKRFELYFGFNKFEEIQDCPQQTNSNDCGVYVVAFVEAILSSLLDKNQKLFEFSRIARKDFILNLRYSYLNLIYQLAK